MISTNKCLLVLVLICSCANSFPNDTEYLPLLDNDKAVLIADIDVTNFNRKMEKLITVKVPANIKENFENYIMSERFKGLVRSESTKEMSDLANDIVNKVFDKFVKSEEFKKNLDMFAKGLLEDKLNNHVKSQDFKEFIRSETKEEIEGLAVNLTDERKTLEKKIHDITNTTVALTSCNTDAPLSSSLSVIKFQEVKYKYGVRDLSLLSDAGTFKCEHAGIYLIIVNLTKSKSAGDYFISKNNVNINNCYVSVETMWQEGSCTIVTYLQVNDQISVKVSANTHVTNNYTCLTLVKIS